MTFFPKERTSLYTLSSVSLAHGELSQELLRQNCSICCLEPISTKTGKNDLTRFKK